MHAREVIEAHYRAAGARMAGLPVYNPALAVELFGWRAVEDVGVLGVLITPWCMNLFWQPPAASRQPPADAELPASGERPVLSLPSGDYECSLHEDERLGRHASASLCSPMQDFPGEAEARAMAEEVLRLILTVPQAEPELLQSGLLGRRALPSASRPQRCPPRW
ncbi:[NiFe]-hydrogenase assembly chaperone HybE [Azorhizophilus paspali]|uniref:[NiFe]-hydrogenase assembly chaperone HybE n=1 Tax=Azorhizophilus paspali TaxID=69963 RepID=A0ABV6SV87_AZOPA